MKKQTLGRSIEELDIDTRGMRRVGVPGLRSTVEETELSRKHTELFRFRSAELRISREKVSRQIYLQDEASGNAGKDALLRSRWRW